MIHEEELIEEPFKAKHKQTEIVRRYQAGISFTYSISIKASKNNTSLEAEF